MHVLQLLKMQGPMSFDIFCRDISNPREGSFRTHQCRYLSRRIKAWFTAFNIELRSPIFSIVQHKSIQHGCVGAWSKEEILMRITVDATKQGAQFFDQKKIRLEKWGRTFYRRWIEQNTCLSARELSNATNCRKIFLMLQACLKWVSELSSTLSIEFAHARTHAKIPSNINSRLETDLNPLGIFIGN